MEKLKIVFMGTPEFAVGILDTIIKNNFDVVGVITAPDRPAGRGQKIKFAAVKDFALKKGLPILQPTNLKDEAFLSALKALNGNCQIVVAFRMLPEVVWKMPKYGTINLHASLLPNYRGAAPINWAIINGETETGVTTFFIDEKIDTGAMILNAKTTILENENAGQLHDRLMALGSETMIDTLHLIEKGKVQTTIQTENPNQKTAYKLNRDNCKIDWKQSGEQIVNLIRGLSPYPTAWCLFKDNNQEWNVKINKASFEREIHDFKIGQIITSKKELKIAVKEGFVKIIEIQFPGKKNMAAAELLNGLLFSSNAIAV
ncbi:methionyl-tRNA formyltransferase [Flavobacterium sp. UBA6135]|uniref:methionyl-tRNA formyltransferase n=1 Tax=Flavobacterium sp. UBA6135 TaxID=1946553 RepID=UPI0025BD924F|nr:methionyl-tRNA formyltransferase [Flavobacterium sp. UBA6135]